ncbi:MAG: glycoside hydrolase, partial [Planctomycetia bacterium]|nr:glycoside hydrolase [Planctomycetia bacterium]
MKKILLILFLALSGTLFGQTLENESLKLTFHPEDGAFDVLDKSTGRNWTAMSGEEPSLKVSEVKAEKNKIAFDFKYEKLKGIYHGSLELSGRELTVRISGDPKADQVGTRIGYPYPFEAKMGERILIPHGCGFAFPVEMADLGAKQPDLMSLYNRDMNMGVWGHYAETLSPKGEILPACGYMAIIETPENASVHFTVRKNGLRQINILWNPDMMKFGYDRTLRYVFFEKCNAVNIAKRYRKTMIEKGYLVPFAEKKKRLPKLADRIDLLIGAPNIWYWGKEKVEVAKQLKKLGFDNFLMNCAGGAEAFWGLRSSSEEVQELAKIPRMLVGCYDIYNDLIEPERLGELRYISSDWVPEAWTNNDIILGASGKPSRGWGVYPKDPKKPMIRCAILCSTPAIDYARKRISRILETDPYSARFFDVTGTGLGECWNPKHPLTRRESVAARQNLLSILGKEFNLIAGTEDGMECYVPCCDYLEGMFSAPNHYRVGNGRNMWEVWDDVPDNIRIGSSEDLRVPFWELVFHDCIVSYWYWCDYNNK